VTARPEEYKQATEQWLSAHGVKYALVLMRKIGDFRKGLSAKKEFYEQSIKGK